MPRDFYTPIIDMGGLVCRESDQGHAGAGVGGPGQRGGRHPARLAAHAGQEPQLQGRPGPGAGDRPRHGLPARAGHPQPGLRQVWSPTLKPNLRTAYLLEHGNLDHCLD